MYRYGGWTMSGGYLIGVDLGTTFAKCVLYDIEGAVVAEEQKMMEIIY
jgi:sugar (pentulose or hexulose) kinase